MKEEEELRIFVWIAAFDARLLIVFFKSTLLGLRPELVTESTILFVPK